MFVGNDIPLSNTSVTVQYSTTPIVRHMLHMKMPKESNIIDHIDANDDDMIYSQHVMGPNVIVEPLPYSLSHMDTVLDIEREFSSLVNMPDPELSEEGFFDYGNW